MIYINKNGPERYCRFCFKKTNISINDFPLCESCADGELMRIIKKCCDNLSEVSVIPKVIFKPKKRRKKNEKR